MIDLHRDEPARTPGNRWSIATQEAAEGQPDGRAWNFEINAAAMVVWTSGAETRHFGGSDLTREPPALTMPEPVQPWAH